MTKYKYSRKKLASLYCLKTHGDWTKTLYKDLLATVDKPHMTKGGEELKTSDTANGLHNETCDKQCTTCGCLKFSNPTPDGDEICPDCGGDCMDYPKVVWGEPLRKSCKKPTPSPLDEIEEIEETTYDELNNNKVDKPKTIIGTKINALIRNQNRLVEVIKTLNQK